MAHGVRSLASLVLVLLTFMVAPLSAVESTYPYHFTIDPQQSVLTLTVEGTLPLSSGDTDVQQSAVTGYALASVRPPSGQFNQIHLTDLALDLVETYLAWHLDVRVILFNYPMDFQAYNLQFRMGSGYGAAGAAVPVAAQQFNQTGNLVQGIGRIDYDTYSLGYTGTLYLQDTLPLPVDFAGTTVDDGVTTTLTIPNISLTLDVDDLGLVFVYVTGHIVATAPTVPRTDINLDGAVDLDDFAVLAAQWLDSPCTVDNNWCRRADISENTQVALPDLQLLADDWLLTY